MLDYMDEISEEDYSRFSVFRNNYNGANKKINAFIDKALTEHERISPHLLETKIRTDQGYCTIGFSVFRFITTRKVQWH